jgi:hypothetical protein
VRAELEYWAKATRKERGLSPRKDQLDELAGLLYHGGLAPTMLSGEFMVGVPAIGLN